MSDPRDPREPIPGLAGHDHPKTSKDVAVRGAVRFGTERAEVLRLIAESGSHGMNASEVAVILKQSPNQIATRFLDLRRTGWIIRDEAGMVDGEMTYRKRPTASGIGEGIVHVLHPLAHDPWRRLRMDMARAYAKAQS
jgi:hypothetical protein